MADTIGTNMPEKDTQEPAMPAGEQKTTDVSAQEEVAQERLPETPEQTEQQELPDEVKERTRLEFEKLKENNQKLFSELKEERGSRQRLEDIFKSITAQPQAQAPQVQQPVPVYDPTTGLLNEEALNNTQNTALDAQRKAEEAQAAALKQQQEFQKYLQDLEAREAFTAYPELDPRGLSGKPHDKELHIETRKVLMDSMLNPDDYGGKQLSFKQGADLAKAKLTQKVEEIRKEAKQEGAAEAIESISPKEQAALEAGGVRSSGDLSPEEEQDLVLASRKGDVNALAARVSRFRKQPKS